MLGDIHRLLCLLIVLLISCTLSHGTYSVGHALLVLVTPAILMWGVTVPVDGRGLGLSHISRKLLPTAFLQFDLNKSKLAHT
jgi:hypothetical protein